MDGGGGADRPTPAMDGVAERRPGLSLLSGPVCAAVFICFALCIIIFFVYSFLARRRDISDARERFLRGISERDIEVPGWPGNLPVPLPPPPPAATTPHRVEGGNSNSNSGPGDCPVCLEPLQLQGGSNIMAAHACGHVFHAPCIEPWLPQGGTCPVCPHVPPPPPPPPPPSRPAPRRPRRPQGANSTSTSIGDCPVCMEPLQQVGGGNTRARAAHASVHVFHSSCIESWLHQQGSCPICRCTIDSTFTSNNSNPTFNPNSTSNSNSNSNSSTVGDCPVCLHPLRVDSGAIRAAHACGHVLHSRCIQRWLRGRGSCPVCRCTANHDSNSVDSSPIGDCSVCLEPLRVPDGDVTAAHACGHVFHSRCIDQWLRIRNSCPVCRCNVSCSRGNPRNEEVASAPAAAAPAVRARHIQDTMVVVIVEETTE